MKYAPISLTRPPPYFYIRQDVLVIFGEVVALNQHRLQRRILHLQRTGFHNELDPNTRDMWHLRIKQTRMLRTSAIQTHFS